MIKYDKALLSEKDGITSTSAQHLCNVGNEYIRGLQTDMDNISFVNSSANVLGAIGAPVVLGRGVVNVDNVEKNISQIAAVHAFIAWMREGIKAKDEVISSLATIDTEDWCEDQGITYPVAPVRTYSINQIDVLKELSIKERARYYTLEAQASTLGKLIHPKGAIHAARTKLFDVVSKPSSMSGDKVYTYTPSIDAAKVDTLYFALQKKHREVEASFNAVKGSLGAIVQDRNLVMTNSYNAALKAHNEAIKEIIGKVHAWTQEKTIELRKLKITIPEDLKEIYDFLSTL